MLKAWSPAGNCGLPSRRGSLEEGDQWGFAFKAVPALSLPRFLSTMKQTVFSTHLSCHCVLEVLFWHKGILAIGSQGIPQNHTMQQGRVFLPCPWSQAWGQTRVRVSFPWPVPAISLPFCLLLITNQESGNSVALSVNYFLLYGDIKVHGASLIFTVWVESVFKGLINDPVTNGWRSS